ncbi:MAG: DUF393 domain-containing protein [Planctomycetes bacterium]|nr:DUF393 domain-containing protein [Planctomycetota bacterium]
MIQIHADPGVEVFYDGGCPLCRREIDFLRRRDRHGRIVFTDIDDASFDDSGLEFDRQTLMSRIHGRLPDGTWIEGVEVFRRLYSAIGWNGLVAVTRFPGLRWLLDRAYSAFARNRLSWTGRCSERCPARLERDS